jgi:very-short-patch-repair endonuclease
MVSARALRKNPTDAERRLWTCLRHKQLDEFRFRRQAPIGPYVVDFACFSARLVVEADGGHHALRSDQDTDRTKWRENEGFRVIRFWNSEVLGNTEGVVETIRRALRDVPPSG